MIFKHQKIILTLELIAVIAVTIYSGGYALNAPTQVAAETVAETEMESTTKESKEESETKKSKEKKTVKETKKKDKKSETKAESETVKKVAENKDKSDKKDNTSSGNTANASGNKKDNNSVAPASGTPSKPAGNVKPAAKPSGNNNSRPTGNESSIPAPSGGTSSTPANNPKPVTPSPSTPQTQAPETTHKHNWVEKTRTVHHEATGHYEDVVVQEAWDEPIYGMVEVHICAECGEIDSSIDPNLHLGQTGHSNWWSEWKSVQIDSIHHDAVTESKWVEDSAAWDETVSDGYTCSGCGATK